MAAKIEENSKDIVKTNNRVDTLESRVEYLEREILKINAKDVEYKTI